MHPEWVLYGQLLLFLKVVGVFPVHFLNALTKPLGSAYPKTAEISLTEDVLLHI